MEAEMAVECRSACSKAVFVLLNGDRPNLGNLGHCRGNEGSQNWPWGWALVHQDWDRLNELLDEELARGMRTAEFGSEKYDPDVVAYRVAALARLPADHPVRGKLAASLRAYLAYLALTAVPGPRSATRLHQPEGVSETDGDARYYSGGVSIATPGHRWHPDSVAQSLLGPLLAWALGYPASYRRRIVPCNPDPGVSDDYTWPLALCQLVLGTPYGKPTPPEAWGLQGDDRALLRALIDGDDVAAGPQVAAMIRPYPLVSPLFVEVVGTTAGRMARLEHAVSGLKPQIACCKIDRGGRYEAVVPSSWSRGSADLANTEDRGDRIFARAGRDEIAMDKIGGEPLFRFTWDANGPRWGGDAAVPPRPQPHEAERETTPPPALQPPPPPPPGLSEELARIADGIAGLTLANRQRSLQGQLVAELRTQPRPPRDLPSIAQDVRSFGINPDTEQGSTWQGLIARLEALAARET